MESDSKVLGRPRFKVQDRREGKKQIYGVMKHSELKELNS